MDDEAHAQQVLPPQHMGEQECGQRIQRHYVAASGIGPEPVRQNAEHCDPCADCDRWVPPLRLRATRAPAQRAIRDEEARRNETQRELHRKRPQLIEIPAEIEGAKLLHDRGDVHALLRAADEVPMPENVQAGRDEVRKDHAGP